jgi:hypothetical protein
MTTGVSVMLVDCLQEMHSNQLSFLGVKCVGQHRNLQQPTICQSARIAPAPVVRIPTPPTPLPEQNEAIALQPSQTDTVDFTCGKCMSCDQIFGCCKLRCCPTHLTPKKENWFECISCKQS